VACPPGLSPIDPKRCATGAGPAATISDKRGDRQVWARHKEQRLIRRDEVERLTGMSFEELHAARGAVQEFTRIIDGHRIEMVRLPAELVDEPPVAP
jgi:hypothetical protein